MEQKSISNPAITSTLLQHYQRSQNTGNLADNTAYKITEITNIPDKLSSPQTLKGIRITSI